MISRLCCVCTATCAGQRVWLRTRVIYAVIPSYTIPHAVVPLPPSPTTWEWLGFLSSPFALHRLPGPTELVVILRSDTSQGLLPSRTVFGMKRIRVTFKLPLGHCLPPLTDGILSNGSQPPDLTPLWEALCGPSFCFSISGAWISPMGRLASHGHLAPGVCRFAQGPPEAALLSSAPQPS